MNDTIQEELRLIKSKLFEMQQEIDFLKNNQHKQRSYFVEYANVQFDLDDVTRIIRHDENLGHWRRRALITVFTNDGNSFNLNFGVRDDYNHSNSGTETLANNAFEKLQKQIKDFKNGTLLEKSD